MDLISVIIPIYKVEKYLKKCINSVLNQTYSNLEIILVDDGSPDNCRKICDNYKKKDKRIKVIHKKNGGLSDARNKGIAIAQGKYISFIDSDDYIEKNMIELLYNNLKKENADISICNYYTFNEEQEKLEKESPDTAKQEIEIFNSQSALKKLMSKNSFGDYAWNKLYSAKLFSKVKYPVGKKMEDLGTTYKLFLLSNKIVYTNKKLYNYLQRNGSIANSKTESLMKDRMDLAIDRYNNIKKIYPYMLENNAFLLSACVDSYIYLETIDLRNQCEKAIKDIPHKLKALNLIDLRGRVKVVMYLINKKLYYNFFNQRRRNKNVSN